ncbi:MAG: helix-turn-helix domain-containing protein [Lachnospiraceae bacterium]
MTRTYMTVNTKLSGKKLQNAIKNSGYSIRELQDMLDLSCPNPIYKWIRGETLPSTVNLYRLSHILQIPMEKLLAAESVTIHREYVPETEEPQRQELYRIAKEHYDKAIYLLQEETGIYITLKMAETLAENYVIMRAYNYIDATVYNIPWYLIYSFTGFPLYHMIIRKNTTLYRHLIQLGSVLKDSKIKGHVYVENSEGCLLTATNYRYVVDENENLNEWLDFSIIRPDATVTDTLLYVPVDRFSVSVDSYHFGNLINYQKWSLRQNVLDIAKRYMEP